MLTARSSCIYPDGFRRRGCGSVTLGIAHHVDVFAVKLDAGHVLARTELVEPAQIVAEHDAAALPAGCTSTSPRPVVASAAFTIRHHCRSMAFNGGVRH